MKIACPSCSKGLSVPDERAGAKTRCPACKQVFVVPPLEEDVPEAEIFDDTATLPAHGASAMAAAKATSAEKPSPGNDRRAKQIKAKLAEGKMFLGLAETNVRESRPDLLEVDLAREAFELVLQLAPGESEANRGLAREAELRGKTELALETQRAASRKKGKRSSEEAPEEEATTETASTELEATEEQVPAKKKKKSIWQHVSNFFTKYVCPKCNARGGVETHSETVERFEHMGTTIQTDQHYSNDSFTPVGYTDRQVQVLCETVVYDQYYRCDDCGHEWGERLKNTHRL